ncbi:integrase [Lederbergia wuyishanensis]|uniref:Integrase n=1 Tax=Lederbergia wuyishanensis TaxID=1347903 RepID=A0ABU0D6X0_9BACI|nr:integrase [Lederbergia wuyishanensis]MCJ8008837.1 integrase [Lederbergia wuyishanensis]MDQ0344159.1 hypothetical protein [Lederbergia wuyishanensis]
MNKRNTNKRIKNWILSTTKAVDMDIELKIMHTGINMSYDFIYHFLCCDMNRVLKARNSMKQLIPIESYVKTLTLHELGHAMDRDALLKSLPKTIEIFKMKRNHLPSEYQENAKLLQMLIDEHVMNIEFEETAWRHAETLNRLYEVVNWYDFQLVKDHSLYTYRALYEFDLRHFNSLVMKEDSVAVG